MKKVLTSLIVMVVCFSLAAPPVWAGSKQRRRWEGVAIGIGAAILGHALINNHNRHRDNAAAIRDRGKSCYIPPRPRSCRREVCRPCRGRSCRGHWEVKKVWVPPTYKEVWNPGHYNRRGKWVPGQWIKIVAEEGRWAEDKVWIK